MQMPGLLHPRSRSAGEKAASALSGGSSGGVRERAVDPHLENALGGAHRIGEGCGVDDIVGIEKNQIGGESLADKAPPLELETLCGHAGHFKNGLGERDQFFFAAVAAEYARKSSPQAGMRARIVGKPVGADHRGWMGENSPHVLFRDAVIDGPGGLEAWS